MMLGQEAEGMLCRRAEADFALSADPRAAGWKNAGTVWFDKSPQGVPVPGHKTQVHCVWTERYLYFLFVSPYGELNLRPNPSTTKETNGLWDWDVVELFLSAEPNYLERYREFELSPQREWLDLDITRRNGTIQEGWQWNSGLEVEARIDRQDRIWYGAMKIPVASIGGGPAASGREFRISLCRIQGPGPDRQRKRIVWYPSNFHKPSNWIRLVE
jgi:hypothetical protein